MREKYEQIRKEREEIIEEYHGKVITRFKKDIKLIIKDRKLFLLTICFPPIFIFIPIIPGFIFRISSHLILFELLKNSIAFFFAYLPALLVFLYIVSIRKAKKIPKTILQLRLISKIRNGILLSWILFVIMIQVFFNKLPSKYLSGAVNFVIFMFFLLFLLFYIFSLKAKIFETDYHMFFIKYSFLDSINRTKIQKEIKLKTKSLDFSIELCKILKRLSSFIEYQVYPKLKVKTKEEDGHRLLLSIMNNEKIILNQFIDMIIRFNLREFEDFYCSFHKLIQMLRSDNLLLPLDSFMFEHKSKIHKIIEYIIKILFNPIVSGIIVSLGILLIRILY